MQTTAPTQLLTRQRDMLRMMLKAGPCSRSQLYHTLGLRKNTVTDDVALLLAQGLVRERPERAKTATPNGGRPRVPLEIDPQRRCLVGLAIEPGRVLCGRVDLYGQPLGEPVEARAAAPSRLLSQARRLLGAALDDRVHAVGLSVPGFLDLDHRRVVFSAAWPDAAPINLDPLIEQAAPRPVIAHNDVLALAARWLLLHNDTPRADHLLVTLGDGELGAALLVEGRPTGDGLAGANELGHMRLDVPTPRCYCGHTGCLERICSTDYLRQLQSDMPSLAELVGQQGEPPEPLADLLDRVSRGLANAINFSRVSSVSLAGRFGGTAMPFLDALARRTREQVLRVLRDRCVIDCWDLQGVRSSTVAAALGMAHVYLPGW